MNNPTSTSAPASTLAPTQSPGQRFQASAAASPEALRIERLKFNYHRGDQDVVDPGPRAGGWVVDLPTLRVARGEQMLLTGGSGTGKSTLLHLIAGLEDPAEGVVEVAGRKIHQLHGAARDRFRGRHVGMIFQTFNLLHGFSALENVMAALMFSEVPASQHRERARALLDQLGIARMDAPPDRLSVGQQQRVAVARAVACDPELVLADEPTASLDPENAGAAMDLIQQTCRDKGAALLCVSHDRTMASRFDRQQALEHLQNAPRGS